MSSSNMRSVRVDLILAAELLFEIASENLDVAGFVDDLRAGVQLGVVPRYGLDDLGGAQQRACSPCRTG